MCLEDGDWVSKSMHLLTTVSMVDLGRIEVCVGIGRDRQRDWRRNEEGCILIMARMAEGQRSQCSTTVLYTWGCSR